MDTTSSNIGTGNIVSKLASVKNAGIMKNGEQESTRIPKAP